MSAATRPLFVPTASDLMRRDVVTILQDTPLREAAELFIRRQVGEAAVVDADGRCVGMLSETDLLRGALKGVGGLEAVQPPACPYQVKGRLPRRSCRMPLPRAGREGAFSEIARGRFGGHGDLEPLRPDGEQSHESG
jgi:hypothetical protein